VGKVAKKKTARRVARTRGDENADWIETHLRIPEGKFVGHPVRLRDWQRDVIRGIYDSPTRLGIVSFGRKNGKTALAAMLTLLHLCGPEHVKNSQLVSDAQSKEQAALLFALAAKMARMSPDISSYLTIRDTIKELYCRELGTLYKALSADAKTKFGLSPVFAVHDELGQVVGPRSPLYEAIETAMGAHDSPLSIIISTQAATDADLLSVLIDDAKSGADPRNKVFLYSASLDLDPFSDEAIVAANPAYGDFLNADEARKTADDARRMPSLEAGYRNLILNQRVSQTSPFIPQAVWNECAGAVDPEVFAAGECYIGLDLSSRNDLTALVMVAQDSDGAWHVRPQFFAPSVGLADRCTRDRVPYDVFAQQSLLELTPGASVDYDIVARRLVELCDAFPVVEIAFDRWRIDVLKASLARIGREDLPLVEFGQGFRDMSPALDQLEAEMLNRRLRHGGNALLKWNAANAIAVRDPAGNRKLDKSKSTGRIDGVVALAMAIGTAAARMNEDPEPGMYLL
jgi:phage terminase large subunit-like protein